MSQPRMLSRHNSRQSSIACETASVASIRSFKSEHSHTSSNGHHGSRFKSNGLETRQNSQESSSGTSASLASANGSQPSNILNVAEMLLHGVADDEILDIWLRSIQCEEFLSNFINAGYDMPTLSRITPQDLTAIGVTDPTKRAKIISEIKKLNLQDGIPKFRPANLSDWLNLISLDKYYKLLCDQDIDTIDKLCQLTWEDFEELGITKLGHQKRIQLAVERLKELDSSASNSIKPISEPIYDTNPSQILLMASAENHCMNGPIIHKQSSTSELSSTCSGSMQSVYSAASNHYQPTYGSMTGPEQPICVMPNQTLPDSNRCQNYSQQAQASLQTQQQQKQQQAIYSQPMPSLIYQQPSQLMGYETMSNHASQPQMIQSQHSAQLQTMQQFPNNRTSQQLQFPNLSCQNNEFNMFGHGTSIPQNRQSMSQIPPIGRLANLPKHQQQLLQQSSIYATLTRQPMNKLKRTPPPVPIRTDSLKSNPNAPEGHHKQKQKQYMYHLNRSNPTLDYRQLRLEETNITPSGVGFRSNISAPNGNKFISQPMLTNNNISFNATTGKDDDFPPPPSPLPSSNGESYGLTT